MFCLIYDVAIKHAADPIFDAALIRELEQGVDRLIGYQVF